MDPKLRVLIGYNIRLLRKKKGLSQKDLSLLLQINGWDTTRSIISKIEAGERYVYPDELIVMRKVLNASYDEILFVPEEV